MSEIFHILSLTSIFLIAALGLHFTFGLAGVLNLVHGELILVGAYTAFAGADLLGSVWLGVLLAPVVVGAVGLIIERGLIRHFYEKQLAAMLITFGLSMIIQQVMQILYSPTPRQVPDPLGSSFVVADHFFPKWRVFVIAVTALVVVLIWVVMNRTELGLRTSAAIRNARLAESFGINVNWVRAILFTCGCALAGLAGALIVPLGTLDPQFGVYYLTIAFLVVIVGRVGSLKGLVVAAFILAFTQNLLEGFMSTVFAQIVVLAVAIVVIRVRGAERSDSPPGRIGRTLQNWRESISASRKPRTEP